MADDTKSQREDFQAARRALVDRVVADHPGLSHTDFNDVAIAEFDSHAKTLSDQRAAATRTAAAAELNMTPEEYDAFRASRAADKPASTPQSRTASLPAGNAGSRPGQARTQHNAPAGQPGGEGAWGVDLIEQKAAEDVAVWQRTGKWPARDYDTFG